MCFITNKISQLVGFIAHPNPQVRVLAGEGLIPYSVSDPSIFKAEDLKPIKHLKTAIQDHHVRCHSSSKPLLIHTLTIIQKVAEHALTILINLTGDPEILEAVATDETYKERLLAKIVVSTP